MVDFLIGFRIAMWAIMIIFANAMGEGTIVPLLKSKLYLLMTNEKTPMRETFTF